MTASGKATETGPLNIAHRGGGGWRPENTLSAFRHAIRVGCDGAELDVLLSGDDQIVVCHNARLDHHLCRKADGSWLRKEDMVPIGSSSLRTLRKYDVGVPNPATDYHARFNRLVPVEGEKIPTLDEVIALAQAGSASFRLVIEIKSDLAAAASRPWQPLVERVLDLVKARGFAKRTILCSFDWGAMIHAKSLMPEIPVWFTSHTLRNRRHAAVLAMLERDGAVNWLPERNRIWFAKDTPVRIRESGGDGWFIHHSDCSHRAVRRIRAAGLTSAAWSVNLTDQREVERLRGSGVDVICSDYP